MMRENRTEAVTKPFLPTFPATRPYFQTVAGHFLTPTSFFQIVFTGVAREFLREP
jgi:hypothetical protein